LLLLAAQEAVALLLVAVAQVDFALALDFP
jgi:hypothetical protein